MNRGRRSTPYNVPNQNNNVRPTGKFIPGGMLSRNSVPREVQGLMAAVNPCDQPYQAQLQSKTMDSVKVEPPSVVAEVKPEDPSSTEDMKCDVDNEETAMDSDAKKAAIATRKARINRIMNKVKPKSSTAILNEMYKVAPYTINTDGKAFQASLTVNNESFVGSGRSKAAAQTAAADEAMKHMVLSGDMHLSSSGDAASGLTHSQLLSYALFKLLNSWDESGNITTRMQAATPARPAAFVKPTKKFPTNPERMHPVMLLSQTHPTATFAEIAYSPPPMVSFTIECTVGEKKFLGQGPNKKDAKKRAAMSACTQLMGVKYATMDET